MVKKIITEIEINASREFIWNILMDFESYPEWNPFVLSIDGSKAIGEKLEVDLKSGEGKSMKFKPEIIDLEENRKFTWFGRLFLPKLFDGKHSFELISINENKTKFRHSEHFSGLFAWLILKFIEENTKSNFQAMNQAIKIRAEENSK